MMYNPAGYDPSGFSTPDLGDPRRQEKPPGGYATHGQAVSAPYAEANMKAAEKTNPMNAASLGAGKSFLDAYVGLGSKMAGAVGYNDDPKKDTPIGRLYGSSWVTTTFLR